MNTITDALLRETISQLNDGRAVVQLPGSVGVYGVTVYGPVEARRADALRELARMGILPPPLDSA